MKFSKASINPLPESAINKAIIFGYSQSGRFIRDFIYQGFNLNTDNRVVFKGAIPVVAGAIGTYSGRATRVPGFAPGQINGIFGGFRQFELTAAARAASGDPRPPSRNAIPVRMRRLETQSIGRRSN